MSNNEPLKLNITFKYKFYDKNQEKYVNYNYNILKNGSFNHKTIRNENFYDYLIQTFDGDDKDDIEKLKKQLENNNNNLLLATPFSNKYLSLDSLDKMIIDKITNNNVPNDLNFQELTVQLKSPNFKDKKYEIKSIDELKYFFIDIINNLFNTGSSSSNKKNNREKLLRFISNYKEESAILDFYKLILYNINSIITNKGSNTTDLKDKIPINDNNEYTKLNDLNDFNFNEISKILIILDKVIESKNESLIKSSFYKHFMSIVKKNEDINKKNIFENFKNKKFMNLFNMNFLDSSGRQIREIFDTLDEDYNKVLTFNKESISSGFYIPASEQRHLNDIRPRKYNTKEELESIIYEYAEHINKDIYNKYKKDKKKLIDYVLQRDKLLKQIITYYNIFKLLSEIYLIQDTIIFDDKNTIKGSPYKKILNIEPMLQRNLDPLKKNNCIDFIYFVKFEDIPNTNIIKFFINIINNEDKIKKRMFDNKENKYIDYGTSIYSKKTNLNEYIIFKDNLDVEKIINKYPLLIRNNNLFKKVNPTNVNEIFINKELFEIVNNESNYMKNLLNSHEILKYIENYYVNELFFKKDNILFKDKKFYQIDKVILTKSLSSIIQNIVEKEKTWHNVIEKAVSQHKTQQNQFEKKDNNIEKAEYNNIEKNIDKRLAYDNIGTSYKYYLDVYCYVKSKIDEKIGFNKKFESFFNCNNNANNLDILFKDLLQEYYSENTFKNLLKSNKSINEVPPIDKAPLINENPEKNQNKKIINPEEDIKDFDKKMDYGGKKLIKKKDKKDKKDKKNKKDKKDKKLIIKKNKKNKKKTIFSKMYYNNNNKNKKLKKYTSKYHKNKRKINLKTKTIKLIKYYLNF